MKKLSERVDGLATSMDRLQRVSKLNDRVKILNTRAEQIDKACKNLIKAKSTEKILLSKGICTTQLKPPDALRAIMVEVQSNQNSDWNTLIEDQTKFSSLIEITKKYSNEINETCLHLWKDFVEEGLIEINEITLSSLSAAGFVSECNNLSMIYEAVMKLSRRCPNSPKDIEDILDLKNELRSSWEQLSQVPNNIREFLQKASQGRAQFSDLSEEVRKWLEHNKIIYKLRIILVDDKI